MDSFYWRGAEGPCLASYLSNGNVQVHSLPSLRPLLTADLVPLAELNFQSNKPANLVDPMVNIWAHQIFASEDAGRYAPKPPDVVHILFESHPLGIDVYQSAKHQRLTQFSGLVHRSLLLLGLHSLPLPLGTTSTNVFFYSFRFFFFVFFLTGSVAISDSATTATACICARRPKSESSPFLRRLRTFSPLICRSLGFFFKMTSFRWTSKFHPTGLALKKNCFVSMLTFFFSSVRPRRSNLNELMGELFLPCEMPEPPKEGLGASLIRGLFGGGVRVLDREELCQFFGFFRPWLFSDQRNTPLLYSQNQIEP